MTAEVFDLFAESAAHGYSETKISVTCCRRSTEAVDTSADEHADRERERIESWHEKAKQRLPRKFGFTFQKPPYTNFRRLFKENAAPFNVSFHEFPLLFKLQNPRNNRSDNRKMKMNRTTGRMTKNRFSLRDVKFICHTRENVYTVQYWFLHVYIYTCNCSSRTI